MDSRLEMMRDQDTGNITAMACLSSLPSFSGNSTGVSVNTFSQGLMIFCPDNRIMNPAQQQLHPETNPPLQIQYNRNPINHSTSSRQQALQRQTPIILGKKIRWKDYPELEQFLIVNTDEYLWHARHSSTTQQSRYNNDLTRRLMEVACRYNYIFDPEIYNFDAIRDRIRRYYHLFVTSIRRRGIPIRASRY